MRLSSSPGKLQKAPCLALVILHTPFGPTLAASHYLFPKRNYTVGLVGFRFAAWLRSDGGGGGRDRRRRRRPHHRPEAGAVVELGGVALRPRRHLLPLPRPRRRSPQDRGVAEQGLPPDPRGGDCSPLRDKAARSLLLEWSCLEW